MSDPSIDLDRLRRLDRRGDATILYHRTTAESARGILVDGFRDSFGTYGMDVELRGVWLSNRPVDMNEGAKGDVLLEVDLDLTDSQLAQWEIAAERGTYREFCIPEEKLRQDCWIRVIEGEDEVIDGAESSSFGEAGDSLARRRARELVTQAQAELATASYSDRVRRRRLQSAVARAKTIAAGVSRRSATFVGHFWDEREQALDEGRQ